MSTTALTSLRSATVVFTGRLANLSRPDAERRVRESGGVVAAEVSRRTSVLVVGMIGWPLSPGGAVNHKLRQAERINRAGPRIRVLSEIEFLEVLGLRVPRAARKTISADDIVRSLGIEHRTLRHWQALGLVRAIDGRYDFQDLVSLRAIADLIRNGVRPDEISRSLHDLGALFPEFERPLAQLSILADGPKTLLADLDEHLITPKGQLVMNFAALEASETAQTPIPCRVREDWFAQGEQLEAADDFEAAAYAYERAIGQYPQFAEAHFNLGNVLRALDLPRDAMTSFRAAIEQDPELVEAWYNLADVQEEQGDLDGAVASLRAAVRIAPYFEDAHFNLAHCLDSQGRKLEAVKHWKRYLELDSTSEWAALARSKLAL